VITAATIITQQQNYSCDKTWVLECADSIRQDWSTDYDPSAQQSSICKYIMQHTLQGKKRKPNQNWLNVFDFNA